MSNKCKVWSDTVKMVRACCVSACHSGKNVPAHLFPRNNERRRSWLESLSIEPLDESEMKKLHVCYKHFCDNNYNCSPNRRILKTTAIPSLHVSSANENTITTNTSKYCNFINN